MMGTFLERYKSKDGLPHKSFEDMGQGLDEIAPNVNDVKKFENLNFCKNVFQNGCYKFCEIEFNVKLEKCLES